MTQPGSWGMEAGGWREGGPHQYVGSVGVSKQTLFSEPPRSPPPLQVFFIRDGIKFPDVIHAFKPNPKNHQQEAWRIMDFLSHHPESCHMVRGQGSTHEEGSYCRHSVILYTRHRSYSCLHEIHTKLIQCSLLITPH